MGAPVFRFWEGSKTGLNFRATLYMSEMCIAGTHVHASKDKLTCESINVVSNSFSKPASRPTLSHLCRPEKVVCVFIFFVYTFSFFFVVAGSSKNVVFSVLYLLAVSWIEQSYTHM